MTAAEVFREMYSRSVARYHVVISARDALYENDEFVDFVPLLYPLAESLVDAAEEFWDNMSPYFDTSPDKAIRITCPICDSELCPMYRAQVVGDPLAAFVVSE